MHVDLNADVGEGIGANETDTAILRQVTSANIACGVHAGSPAIMRATVELAQSLDVAIGAHPGFADPEGFGRREMRVSEAEVEELVLSQMRALADIVTASGASLQHVKPHGALYNMAARDESVASAIARAVRAFDPSLILMGLAGSAMITAAERIGLRTAGEGFADRAYRSDGSLVPRHESRAILSDPRAVIEQALRMITDGVIIAATGEPVRVRVDSLCIHGDTPGASALAGDLRAAFVGAGVTLRALRAHRRV